MPTSWREAAGLRLIRQGAGPTVVLLHGFCSTAESWLPTIAAFAPRFDLIAPNWPGFGPGTGRSPCTSMAEMAACLLRLADELRLSSFHVIGHSMSGFVVQELLRSHGQRIGKAVLYGAGLTTSPKSRFESLRTSIERLRREGAAATADRVCETWFVEGRSAPEFAASAQQGAAMNVEAGIAALRACEPVDFAGHLSGVESEVLVVLGDRDRTFRVADGVELSAAMRNASLCVLPGCAHAAHLERPALFNFIVAAHLETRDARP